MISVDEAQQLLSANAPDRAALRRPVAECLNLITAEDIVSKVTLPPDDASAMDGYAVRLKDTVTEGSTLRVVGEAPAGTPFHGTVEEGEAVRLFTGSKVPDGADHILIQEDAERDGNILTVSEAQTRHAHIRKAGIDFSAGDTLVGAGTLLGPPALALAAASDHAELSVFRPLRVGLIANGDELRLPGDTSASGDIISSNPSALGALIRRWGGIPVDLGIAKDDPAAIVEMIAHGADCDVLVPIGGASVGDHDHMATTFTKSGFELIFQKVAVRPGKPTWFGRSATQRVLGLPGNPASAYVCAHLFLQPLLTGVIRSGFQQAHLSVDLSANGPREHYMRAVQSIENGRLKVTPLPRQDSSLMTPFLEANCLLRRPANMDACSEGTLVETLPLAR